MATSRSWRQHPVDGPFRAGVAQIDELNQVFSDSFTERYRRDGMVGVRVPFLNTTIWRYAIEDAAGIRLTRLPLDPETVYRALRAVQHAPHHRSGIQKADRRHTRAVGLGRSQLSD